MAGVATGALGGAAIAGTPFAVGGALVGGTIGGNIGLTLGNVLVPGVGWVPGGVAGTAVGAGVGAAVAGVPAALVGGAVGVSPVDSRVPHSVQVTPRIPPPSSTCLMLRNQTLRRSPRR